MTVQEINKLIGKVLRRIQLTANELVKFCLKQALKWLSFAKQELRLGRVDWARDSLSIARLRIQDARRYAAIG